MDFYCLSCAFLSLCAWAVLHFTLPVWKLCTTQPSARSSNAHEIKLVPSFAIYVVICQLVLMQSTEPGGLWGTVTWAVLLLSAATRFHQDAQGIMLPCGCRCWKMIFNSCFKRSPCPRAHFNDATSNGCKCCLIVAICHHHAHFSAIPPCTLSAL